MKKDIVIPVVDQTAMAVIYEADEDDEMVWNSYLINMETDPIEGVLVTSKGYGELDGEIKKTSVLRHTVPELPGHSYVKIERIIEEVFGLTNEYWVSFRQGGMTYDKKYVFEADSIKEENCAHVPVINLLGVFVN